MPLGPFATAALAVIGLLKKRFPNLTSEETASLAFEITEVVQKELAHAEKA